MSIYILLRISEFNKLLLWKASIIFIDLSEFRKCYFYHHLFWLQVGDSGGHLCTQTPGCIRIPMINKIWTLSWLIDLSLWNKKEPIIVRSFIESPCVSSSQFCLIFELRVSHKFIWAKNIQIQTFLMSRLNRVDVICVT